MKIYSIIVTYNGEFWIEKCLSSIQNSLIPIKIIVIDNKSTDKTVEIIENGFKNVQLIKSENNLGFGQGNNIGLKIALQENADYVFLLNQDAWIEPDTIQKLVEVQKQYTEFGILSPIHKNYEGTAMDLYFSKIIVPDYCPDFISDLYLNRLQNIYPIKFVSAAAWIISKDCLLKVGLFDPLFPHYGEDNDYVERAVFHGFKIGIITNSEVYHFSSYKSDNEVSKNYLRQLTQSLNELKNINSNFRSNLLIFLKTNHDTLSSLILYRKFSQFFFRFKLFFKIIFCIPKIIKSRKISKQIKAFL